MHRCTRIFTLTTIVVLGLTSSALAQEASEAPAGEAVAPGSTEAAGTEGAPTKPDEGVAATKVMTATAARAATYGVAFRMRWVSVPTWFLNFFTQKNSPLSSYGYAVEAIRRKVDKEDSNRTWELAVGFGYQNMSPPDGYWLGKNKSIDIDTDLVQARNFSLITMDAAFISRQYFSRYFGIHYGAGLGLAIVRGKILRTSARYDRGSGQFTVQGPGSGGPVCTGNPPICNESKLAQLNGDDADPQNPHRFQETSIPSAIPILNLLVGLDFPIPDAKGLEFRVEGGFFDAFFLGGTMGWMF